MGSKLTFEDFIVTVDEGCRDFVKEQHEVLINSGCKLEIKEAKSGFLASYLRDKKTVANYVFRKKGLMIRIYANHLGDYMELLDTLPGSMVKTISGAPVCKRLINPETCNQKCVMGYDFILHGEHLQKCRNNAFMFLVNQESMPYIQSFLENELKA